jgi:REP element-mobilizing transposase RayT
MHKKPRHGETTIKNLKKGGFTMPRCARVKSFDSMYHIMVRSISDTLLFKCSADKDMYLRLIKKYKGIFLFNVYAFCIMDTHAHIIIDCNGADISKIMHGINQCYAQYFNYKYHRHGHLFQDRFKSKIVYDDRNALTLSAYIHTNPDDIKGYSDKWEKYRYSSMGIILGLWKDDFNIVDRSFILDYFGKDVLLARKKYYEFVKHYNGQQPEDDVEFANERSQYRSERVPLVRNARPEIIVDFVSSYIKEDKLLIHIKYIRDAGDLKPLCAFMMRELCDMKQKDICKVIGNITQSHAAKLCLNGFRLINEKAEYRNLVNDFLSRKAS